MTFCKCNTGPCELSGSKQVALSIIPHMCTVGNLRSIEATVMRNIRCLKRPSSVRQSEGWLSAEYVCTCSTVEVPTCSSSRVETNEHTVKQLETVLQLHY
jgi:hypothetical protein